MITLYQFETGFGLPNLSPFCMKVETYLRMAGLEFQTVNGANPRSAPNQKLPYIEDGGKVIGDSGFIIEYLDATYGIDFDGALSSRQRAYALALRRLIEEHLYFAMVHVRWMDENAWPEIRRAYFGRLPPVVRDIVPLIARRTVRTELWGQGMGRHAADKVVHLAEADLDALADALGDSRYFMGLSPTSVDATAYAFLENLLAPPLDNPIRRAAQAHDNLVTYTRRMREQFYAPREQARGAA